MELDRSTSTAYSAILARWATNRRAIHPSPPRHYDSQGRLVDPSWRWDMTTLTESDVEQLALEWLEGLGWRTANGLA